MGLKIYDNFLPEANLTVLKDMFVLNEFLPLYLQNKVALPTEEDHDWNWYATHSIYMRDRPVSEQYDMIKDLILDKVMEVTETVSLLRMRLNFYPHTETMREHYPHKDFEFPHVAGIYCLNPCDGFTRLSDGTKVDSIENRFYTFDGHLEHNSSTTTNSKGRFNINFNLI